MGAKLHDVLELLNSSPDSYTVQSCCLSYGGNSFPKPIADALKCHISILRSKVLAYLPSKAS
jgi:hypothetical protein